MTETSSPPWDAHAQVRLRHGTTQLPEITELAERGLEAGLHVREDMPDPTPYATAGVCIFQPTKRPPATLVVQYLRPGVEKPFRLWLVLVYPEGSKMVPTPITDPDLARKAIDDFLETYRGE